MLKPTVLIVDDEKLNRDILEILILKHCPEINLVAKCHSAADARLKLESDDINLLFLDIAMPNETGFELLESIEKRDFSVIFITAYNQFALNAIKANALDYILKPINFEELKIAVNKAVLTHKLKLQNGIQTTAHNENLNNLIGQINNNSNQITSLSVPTKGGYKIINLENINYFEASNNYCIIYMINQEEFIVSKTLKEFNEILADTGFIRIHKTFLVNKDSIVGYIRENGITIELKNGKRLSVSRRRQALFLAEFNF